MLARKARYSLCHDGIGHTYGRRTGKAARRLPAYPGRRELSYDLVSKKLPAVSDRRVSRCATPQGIHADESVLRGSERPQFRCLVRLICCVNSGQGSRTGIQQALMLYILFLGTVEHDSSGESFGTHHLLAAAEQVACRQPTTHGLDCASVQACSRHGPVRSGK